MSDISLVDPGNSSTTLLLANGVFTGSWTDVTDYSSVSVIVASNTASAANGYRIQWSEDGINLDDEQRFTYASFASEQSKVLIASTRARFFRIVYTNTFTNQTFFRLQAMLRRGTAQGSISPAGIQITNEHDAVTTNSVLVARDIATPTTLVMPFATSDPFLIVEHPPNRSVQSERTVAASLFSSQLDFFGLFGQSRRHMHILNDTVRGTLHIRFGGAASLTSFNVKLPPQHFWELPQAWGYWSGTVFGIWDVADGFARLTEWF